jgi:hypothetical protein
MMAELIVLSSVVLAVVFVIAWLVRPEFRSWLERPAQRFVANAREADRLRRAGRLVRKGTSN